MPDDPVIYRDEVMGTLFTINDLNAHLRRIVDLLEGEHSGEEGIPEEDS